MSGRSAPNPGLPIHVLEEGRTGPPLVLLHGFGAHSFTWRHWVPDLSRDHRVIMIDLKGFGAAPKPRDEGYGPADHATLVLRYLRARHLAEATVVGHSYGGTVALLLAVLLLDEEPQPVSRMILVGAAGYPQELPRYMRLASLPLIGELLLGLVPSTVLARAALRSTYRDPDRISEDQVRAYARPLRTRGGRRGVIRTARRILTEDPGPWISKYPEIQAPALLLWGDSDPIVPPAVGRRLEEDLPHAHLVLVDDCGHVPQEEKPEESLAAVRDFLRASS